MFFAQESAVSFPEIPECPSIQAKTMFTSNSWHRKRRRLTLRILGILGFDRNGNILLITTLNAGPVRIDNCNLPFGLTTVQFTVI